MILRACMAMATVCGSLAMPLHAQGRAGVSSDSGSKTIDRAERLEAFLKRDSVPPARKTAGRVGGDEDAASDAGFLAARPKLIGIGSLDSAAANQYASALRAYYEYRVSGLAHRRAVFEWQLFSSRVIFWSVIVLVATGIAFSGIQFRASLEGARAARAQAMAQLARSATVAVTTLTAAEPERALAAQASSLGLDTSLEASAQGIKVSSPVLGVIILSLSLLFFYLYLSFVYPIQESI